MLDGPPPMPPMGGGPGAPSYPTMVGGGGAAATPGGAQVASGVVRMAMEIDQALKVLAQAAPQLGPWVMKTAMELRQQVGQALQGNLSSQAAPDANFPGGGTNL